MAQFRGKNVSTSITLLTRAGGRKYYIKFFAYHSDLHAVSKNETI